MKSTGILIVVFKFRPKVCERTVTETCLLLFACEVHQPLKTKSTHMLSSALLRILCWILEPGRLSLFVHLFSVYLLAGCSFIFCVPNVLILVHGGTVMIAGSLAAFDSSLFTVDNPQASFAHASSHQYLSSSCSCLHLRGELKSS